MSGVPCMRPPGSVLDSAQNNCTPQTLLLPLSGSSNYSNLQCAIKRHTTLGRMQPGNSRSRMIPTPCHLIEKGLLLLPQLL
jgi:hypothetical protein